MSGIYVASAQSRYARLFSHPISSGSTSHTFIFLKQASLLFKHCCAASTSLYPWLITPLQPNMRVQLMASLALLQFHSCAATASGMGSNAMVGTSGNHGMGNTPDDHSSHGNQPNGGNGANMGALQGGAGSGQGSPQGGKGVPRMEAFPGTHLSPVEGGVVINPLGSATQDKRAVPTGLLDGIISDCPVIDRRGEFLVRRCPKETIGIPMWEQEEMNTEPDTAAMGKKRSPATSEVWTRSDGGESYFECGSIDARGEFIAKRCAENTLFNEGPVDLEALSRTGLVPTASSTEKRASRTAERSLFSSGVPSYIDECGIMGRRGDLLVRFVCCDTNCDLQSQNIGLLDGGDLIARSA